MISFQGLSLTAPPGSVIGVIEEGNPALTSLASCPVISGSQDLPVQMGSFFLDHWFAQKSRVSKAQGVSRLEALRRAGSAIVLTSSDEALLEQVADEIWWLRDGKLVAQGHPAEILPTYRRHAALELRASGNGATPELAPSRRQGDGRAELQSIELAGANGQPSTIWKSGEEVSVRVAFRYVQAVPDPVVGLLIRTRSGLNVYGTNTELEQLHPGPVEMGSFLRVTFKFRCDLCPGDYTITVASHDPDGLWHDWLEDAVAFAVADERYTAGVANLRAKVYAELTASN
jgi:lipopolysaccharide transport system ATP-binding protein